MRIPYLTIGLLALCVGAFGIVRIVTTPETKLPPWTVVCDGQGHYGYTWQYSSNDETALPIGYRNSRMEAEQDLRAAKDCFNSGNETALEAKIIKTQAMPWKVCTEPSVVPWDKSKFYWSGVNDKKYAVTMLTPKYIRLGDGWCKLATNRAPYDYTPATVELRVTHAPTVRPDGKEWVITFAP